MHARSPFHHRADPRRSIAVDTSPLTGSRQKAGTRGHLSGQGSRRLIRAQGLRFPTSSREMHSKRQTSEPRAAPFPAGRLLPSQPRVGRELSTRPFAAASTKPARFPFPHRVPHEALEAEALLLGGVARDDERLRLLAGPGRARGRGRRHLPVPQRPAHFRRRHARRWAWPPRWERPVMAAGLSPPLLPARRKLLGAPQRRCRRQCGLRELCLSLLSLLRARVFAVREA